MVHNASFEAKKAGFPWGVWQGQSDGSGSKGRDVAERAEGEESHGKAGRTHNSNCDPHPGKSGER